MRSAFIIGNPRSGTSLLRLMVNAHPAMVSPPECGFLQWWHAKYRDWAESAADDPARVLAYVDDLLASRKMETWGLDRLRVAEHIRSRRPADYGGLALAVYEHWALRNGKHPRVVVDKNNYYIRHLGELRTIWPAASFIHLVRDGRDVACSYREVQANPTTSPYKPVLPQGIPDIAREWLANNLAIRSFLEAPGGPAHLTLRYEDLVTAPESALARLSGFLGESYAPEMLRYFAANDEPEATIDWKRKTRSAPDASCIGRFRSQLPPQEVAAFEQVAGQGLALFGYA